jgi:predicted AAA+ superfamily ATPase
MKIIGNINYHSFPRFIQPSTWSINCFAPLGERPPLLVAHWSALKRSLSTSTPCSSKCLSQEQLSLSDRFGLTITFLNPDKKEYLDIVEKLACDRHFEEHGVDVDKLLFKADQWATRRGGRSPRGAKQFIDHVEGCIKRGKEW